MATQLLIYERAVPVTRARHGEWSVKTGGDYHFAEKVNSVPLTAAEFAAASAEYPIVFAGTGANVMPVVLLGVREKKNLFVDEKGAWNAKYIPAFIRRYPFVFSGSEKGDSFTLCIDEEFSGCNKEGRGERLFDSQGERTQYLATTLNFLQAYQTQFNRTQAFSRQLAEMNLLEPMQAQFTVKKTGQRGTLGGFQAVSREKLKALDAAKLLALAKTDELELIYTHLLSMRNFNAMLEKADPGRALFGANGTGEDLAKAS